MTEHLNSGDALKSFLDEEFKTTNYGDGWLCPDVSSFELFGDPSQYFEGKMIDAVVNRCDIADKTDKEWGLVPSYTNATCATDLTSADVTNQLESLRVRVKLIS